MKTFGKPGYAITYFAVLALIFFALSSCQRQYGADKNVKLNERVRKIASNSANITPRVSVFQVFACKPARLAFVAAHRGVDSESDLPENSLIGLQKLVETGVMFAEIDVAQLKDGTLILFHDGVWNEDAEGPKTILQKPVAATIWEESQKLLLKNTKGNITAYRPSRFQDVLEFAKDKIYLEIDFKSSASEKEVIAAIRKADMIDRVILIAYTNEQALRLHKLAPEAMLSIGINKIGDVKAFKVRGIAVDKISAWTGKGPVTKTLEAGLRAKNIPILGASFLAFDEKKSNKNDFINFAKPLDLVVTDVTYKAQEALRFSPQDKAAFEKCLKNIH